MTDPKPSGASTTQRPFHHLSWFRLPVCAAVGVLAGVLLARTQPDLAIAAGWTVAATTFIVWTWFMIARMDGPDTRDHSQSEDAGHRTSELVWIVAVFASLGGVGMLLNAGAHKQGAVHVEAGLGVLSVAASWVLVHMLFTLRYAREYYAQAADGLKDPVDFPDEEQPDYQDFIYLSYCLGMTYQVSDTDIRSRLIRRTVTRHTLLSYVLGAVVLACTINLVVQVASQQ